MVLLKVKFCYDMESQWKKHSVAVNRLKRLQNKSNDKHFKEKLAQKQAVRRKILCKDPVFKHLLKKDAEKYCILNAIRKDVKSKKSYTKSSPERKAKKRPAQTDHVPSSSRAKRAKLVESVQEPSSKDVAKGFVFPFTSTAFYIDSGIVGKLKGLYENTKTALGLHSNSNNAIDSDVGTVTWTPSEEIPQIETAKRDPEPFVVVEQKKEKVNEYFETINKYSLLFAVDQKREKELFKWLKNHYHFVVDTKILLKDLQFIEELCKMKFCETNGTVIYVRNCVLQELAQLKQFAKDEGTKKLANRAINYLHSKLGSNEIHIQVQSALCDLERLIEVNSADDKIINCCLQVQRTVSNTALLAEDINLRNKSKRYNISAFGSDDI